MRISPLIAIAAALAALAVLGGAPRGARSGEDPAPPPPPPASSPGCTVVTLPTSDGLTLAADHCPAARPGAPVVLLLHMIPPHHDRSNYPPALRSKLLAAGIEVLNLDRRGGGDSQGDPKQAYTGPHGVKDVQAALDWLRTHSAADLDRWACVGASNGTTTCLDYTVKALDAEGLRGPSALVFLTGGAYTENQNRLLGGPATSVPALFTYNAREAEWSLAAKAGGPAELWSFAAYEPGGHGTRVFEANPESMDDIVRFLASHLPAGAPH
jgi:pimeloyl-ACP methyl ester carboxylesterase